MLAYIGINCCLYIIYILCRLLSNVFKLLVAKLFNLEVKDVIIVNSIINNIFNFVLVF